MSSRAPQKAPQKRFRDLSFLIDGVDKAGHWLSGAGGQIVMGVMVNWP
jgi:hypothetical protein